MHYRRLHYPKTGSGRVVTVSIVRTLQGRSSKAYHKIHNFALNLEAISLSLLLSLRGGGESDSRVVALVGSSSGLRELDEVPAEEEAALVGIAFVRKVGGLGIGGTPLNLFCCPLLIVAFRWL